MNPASIACPSCGASHPLHNPGIIAFVCEYCKNRIFWDEEKIKAAGLRSVLPEGFSRLYRGATGSMFNKRFIVLGRIRYSFIRGFWDEWFLEFDDRKTGYLSEDNYELAWETELNGIEVPPINSLIPGKTTLPIKERDFVVEEVGEAECIGLEGDLPKLMEEGEKYGFADCSSTDGRYTLGIEYDVDPPTLFMGRWLKHAALRLDDEGQDW